MPPGIENHQKPYLNQVSDSVLDVLSDAGRSYSQIEQGVERAAKLNKAQEWQVSYELPVESALQERLQPGKTFSYITGTFDSITHIGQVLKTFHREHEAGQGGYQRTLIESLCSTGQIAAGAAVGVFLSSGLVTISAPAGIALGAGALVSFGVGKFFEAVRSRPN